MSAATQTLESQYGRDSLTVSAIVPTIALRDWLGWVHVSTSNREVRTIVLEKIRGARAQGVRGFDRDIRRETVAAALWLHAENVALYRWVQNGARS